MDDAQDDRSQASRRGGRRRGIVFAMCLSLFALTLAGWAFSYQRVIDLSTPNAIGKPRAQLFLNRGLILIFVFPTTHEAWSTRFTIRPYPNAQGFDSNYWGRSSYGFSTVDAQIPEHATYRSGGYYTIEKGTPWVVRREWGVPYWSVTLIAGLATLLSLRPILQLRRWRREGRCEACGYDTRGISSRCPECGRTITACPTDSAHTTHAL